ncbi:hypothetical protein V8C40DRAFT_242172 [Trichoderma camerunense]
MAVITVTFKGVIMSGPIWSCCGSLLIFAVLIFALSSYLCTIRRDNVTLWWSQLMAMMFLHLAADSL